MFSQQTKRAIKTSSFFQACFLIGPRKRIMNKEPINVLDKNNRVCVLIAGSVGLIKTFQVCVNLF